MTEIWYRAETKRYSIADEWGEHAYTSAPVILFEEYRVLRHTPKGVVVSRFGYEHFVLGTASKQLAVPTKELAVADLAARKRVHASFAAARLRRVEEELALAERTLKGGQL